MKDINTGPTKNLIFEILDRQGTPVSFVAMLQQMTVDEQVFRTSIDELLQESEIEIKFGFVRRRM